MNVSIHFIWYWDIIFWNWSLCTFTYGTDAITVLLFKQDLELGNAFSVVWQGKLCMHVVRLWCYATSALQYLLPIFATALLTHCANADSVSLHEGQWHRLNDKQAQWILNLHPLINLPYPTLCNALCRLFLEGAICINLTLDIAERGDIVEAWMVGALYCFSTKIKVIKYRLHPKFLLCLLATTSWW